MTEQFGVWPTLQDGDGRETVPLRQLGWAFLLAWVFCVFYTTACGGISDGPEGSSAGLSLGQELFYSLMPLTASVAMLVLIVATEPRLGAPTDHKQLFFVAPVLTAVSTPLMFIPIADPVLGGLVFAVGSVATGIGSGLLWVMWGEYYAVIPREKSESLAPLSALLSAGLVLVVSATTGWVPIALATLFPLLSGLCLHRAWTTRCAQTEAALVKAVRANSGDKGHPLAGLGRTGFGILAVFSIVSIAGMLLEGSDSGILQGILVFSALMMALVALFAISGPRRLSLSFLYRWMCPTLVAGFCAVIAFGKIGAVVALAASIGGRFTFCLIAQIYFANYASSGRATPAQSASIGWLFVHLGDLVGFTAYLLLTPLLAAVPDGTTCLCTGCIVILVTAVMFVLNDRGSFHRPLPASLGDDAGAGTISMAPEAEIAVAEGEAACSRPEQRPQEPSTALAQEGTAPSTAGTPAFSPTTSPTDQPAATDTTRAIGALAAEHRLTPRETEVFALLAQGRSIPYIRDELIISRETAATHAKHIYAKLGVHSRQELIDLVRS